MQPCNIGRTRNGQLDTERCAEAFDRALNGKEVLLAAPCGKAKVQALLRQLGDGLLLRNVDVGHLEKAAFGIALAQVVNDHIQQGRCQQRTHDGQMRGDRVQNADDIALGGISGNVQHIQIGISVEGQCFCLIEALRTHGTLGLGLCLLLRRQAAGGDGGSLQEGRHDMLIAVLADDFLGKVGLADLDVLAPAGRNDLHRIAVCLKLDLKLQAVQNVENVIRGNSDAQNGVDAADLGSEMLTLTRGTGRAVEMGGGDLAAAQLLNQMQGAGHAQLSRILRDALFVVAGGIGALAQTAGSLADVVAGELGALKQQLGRGALDLAVQSAHDTCQCDRLGAVADDEVVGRQGEFLLIERCDLLAVLSAADEDLAAIQRVHVKGMHRLADLQHDIVGDIDYIVDAAQAAQGQLTAHPARGLARCDVAHIVADVARAEILRLNADGEARLGVSADGVVGGGHFERLFQHSCNLAGNAQHALAVGAVGSDGDVKDIIVESHNLLNRRAGNGVLRQVEQTVDLRAGVKIIVQPQLLAAAEHTVGLNAHQGLGLDGDAAGQRGAVQCGSGVHTGIDIGCAGRDLDVAAIVTAVHLADVQMRSLLRDALRHNTDNDLGDLTAEVDQLLNLKAAAEELVLQLLRGDINVNILL